MPKQRPWRILEVRARCNQAMAMRQGYGRFLVLDTYRDGNLSLFDPVGVTVSCCCANCKWHTPPGTPSPEWYYANYFTPLRDERKTPRYWGVGLAGPLLLRHGGPPTIEEWLAGSYYGCAWLVRVGGDWHEVRVGLRGEPGSYNLIACMDGDWFTREVSLDELLLPDRRPIVSAGEEWIPVQPPDWKPAALPKAA